jgi:hypothetical protein
MEIEALMLKLGSIRYKNSLSVLWAAQMRHLMSIIQDVLPSLVHANFWIAEI